MPPRRAPPAWIRRHPEGRTRQVQRASTIRKNLTEGARVLGAHDMLDELFPELAKRGAGKGHYVDRLNLFFGRRVESGLRDWIRMVQMRRRALAGAVSTEREPTLNPEAYAIGRECARRGWAPVAPERDVGSVRLRCRTAVDLVVRDAEGKLIVTEIKCANRAVFTEGNGSYLAQKLTPGQYVPATPLARAHLQATIGALLHESSYKSPVAETAVLLVHRPTPSDPPVCEVFKAPPWVKSAKGVLEEAMLARNARS